MLAALVPCKPGGAETPVAERGDVEPQGTDPRRKRAEPRAIPIRLPSGTPFLGARADLLRPLGFEDLVAPRFYQPLASCVVRQ